MMYPYGKGVLVIAARGQMPGAIDNCIQWEQSIMLWIGSSCGMYDWCFGNLYCKGR